MYTAWNKRDDDDDDDDDDDNTDSAQEEHVLIIRIINQNSSGKSRDSGNGSLTCSLVFAVCRSVSVAVAC